MFKGTSIQEFNDYFKCEDDCRNYLFQLKWKGGFSCCRCGCNTSGKGHTSFNLRCKNCNYEESLLANTALHKLKIPLKKAFGIIYRLVIPKRSSSCEDLATEYKVNSKSAWSFAHKVRQAMVLEDESSKPDNASAFKVIDSLIIFGGEKEHNGLQQVNVSIAKVGSLNFIGRNHLSVKCELPEIPQKTNCELHLGKFVKQNKDIRLWNFKTSLAGSNRRCSLKYIQGYINEYFYRSGFGDQKDLIIHSVLARLMMRKLPPAKGYASK